MKKILMISFLAISSMSILPSCSKDPVEVIVDSSKPQGVFSVDKSGNFVDQNAAGSMGTANLGTDEDGAQFLMFDSGFKTSLGTGTVTVYFSTSMDYVADPASGNPDLRLVGICQMDGENYFKLDPTLADGFDYVILWCATANIPFGYAELN